MTLGLIGGAVAFLAAGRGTDHAALTHTWQAVIARGGQPALVSTSRREVELCRLHDGNGAGHAAGTRVGAARVDIYVGDAASSEFCGLVLPGGLAMIMSWCAIRAPTCS